MLKFENVSKQFSKQFILSNFSFEIHQGDKVNISGRSGIGKTTIFRLILGFEEPDTGTIYFNQKPLTNKTVWDIRKQIAYVSQDLSIGNGKVSALFNSTLSLKENLKNKIASTNEIKPLMAFFNLPEALLQKSIDELSGGEKQRVALINALLLKRKIFLLDEFTSALDKALKEKVFNYFFQNKEFTVIYISHDDFLPQNVELKTIELEKP